MNLAVKSATRGKWSEANRAFRLRCSLKSFKLSSLSK